MRRPVLLASAAVLVLAACQGDDASPTGSTMPATVAPSTMADVSTTAPPATSTPTFVAPTAMTEEPGGVRRFGDGRALFAAYDPDEDRTVVATTIGLVVQTGDDAPVAVTPDLATQFAASSDARTVAMITPDGRMEIWDVAAGRQVAAFEVAADRFSAITFAGPSVLASSPTEIVRFGVDGTATTLLEAPAGGRLGPLDVDAQGNVAVPIQADVSSLAIFQPDGTRSDVDLGLDDGARLNAARWAPGGGHLAVLYATDETGDVAGIWDVAAARFTGTVTLPAGIRAEQVAFPAPDRMVLANLGRIVAYSLDGSDVGSFATGPSAIAAIDVADGAVVVSAFDGTLTRWVPGAEPTSLTPRTVTLVDHRGGSSVVVVDQVGLVRVFSADGTQRRWLDRWAVGEATAIDIGADGSIVMAASTGAVRLLDPSGAPSGPVLDRSQGDVSDVSMAPDGSAAATGVAVRKATEAWDDTLEVTDLADGTQDFSLGGEAENVTGCAFYQANVVFSPDGTLLASSSHDFTVQVSPLADPDSTIVLEPHDGSLLDVDFSPDGTRLLTSADDGTVRVWDVDGWSLRTEVTTPVGGFYSMAFSPDGTLLAVSDAAGRISIVDQETAEMERTFTGTRTALGDMAFTPDGLSILAPEPGGAVGVWDVATGTITHELRGHTMDVNALAISSDGSSVVTASRDGTVRSFPLPAQ